MFSAKAANAIIEHSIAINRGKVDDRLLHLVMHGTQRRNARFVAIMITQLHSARNKGVKKFPLERPHKTANIRSVGEKNKDRYGRNIIQVKDHDLCNNFNYGTCK